MATRSQLQQVQALDRADLNTRQVPTQAAQQKGSGDKDCDNTIAMHLFKASITYLNRIVQRGLQLNKPLHGGRGTSQERHKLQLRQSSPRALLTTLQPLLCCCSNLTAPHQWPQQSSGSTNPMFLPIHPIHLKALLMPWSAPYTTRGPLRRV